MHKRVKMTLPCNDKNDPLDFRGSQIKSQCKVWVTFGAVGQLGFINCPQTLRITANPPDYPPELNGKTQVLKIIHAWITKSKVAKIKLGTDLDILCFLASFHSTWKCTVGYWKSKITFNYILLLILWSTIMTGLEGSLVVLNFIRITML